MELEIIYTKMGQIDYDYQVQFKVGDIEQMKVLEPNTLLVTYLEKDIQQMDKMCDIYYQVLMYAQTLEAKSIVFAYNNELKDKKLQMAIIQTLQRFTYLRHRSSIEKIYIQL